jgi:hypothetical protein
MKATDLKEDNGHPTVPIFSLFKNNRKYYNNKN